MVMRVRQSGSSQDSSTHGKMQVLVARLFVCRRIGVSSPVGFSYRIRKRYDGPRKASGSDHGDFDAAYCIIVVHSGIKRKSSVANGGVIHTESETTNVREDGQEQDRGRVLGDRREREGKSGDLHPGRESRGANGTDGTVDKMHPDKWHVRLAVWGRS
ncbi:hypothetical protein BGZ60DRAFT_427828 [Tricladium varicosporioides]|nr:hypothetical protein BGZ60DRAFT_427828 [Hymenoscyphus varicosporioides]